MSLHYLVKYLCSKNDHDPEEIEANCRVPCKTLPYKNLLQNIFLVKYLLDKLGTQRRSHRLYTTAVTKIQMLQQYAIHD